MQTLDAPLFEQWALLTDHVTPRLLSHAARPCPRSVWAVDGASDAVAVSLACHDQSGERPEHVHAFAEGPTDPTACHFTLADIRALPVRVRREGFCRARDGWIPRPAVAEQVFLGSPSEPVDLVVVRAHRLDREQGWSRYADHVRTGGHLLVLGGAPSAPGDPGFVAIEGSSLFRHAGRPRRPAREHPSGREPVPTLARRLLEEDLVERHLNLARGLARRFSRHGEPIEDLRQVAFMALVLAARRYDPDQNVSFSTYATATILGELKRYFRDKSWMMRVPRQMQETYLAVKTAREELYQELACSPTIQQIAGRLGLGEEAVLEAIEAGDNFVPQSLDFSPIDDATGREIPVVDAGFEAMLDRTVLADAIPRLSPREQLVLKRVYLDGWTQRRVAQEVGVSQMQVSRLLRGSGHKVRRWTGA